MPYKVMEGNQQRLPYLIDVDEDVHAQVAQRDHIISVIAMLLSSSRHRAGTRTI